MRARYSVTTKDGQYQRHGKGRRGGGGRVFVILINNVRVHWCVCERVLVCACICACVHMCRVPVHFCSNILSGVTCFISSLT